MPFALRTCHTHRHCPFSPPSVNPPLTLHRFPISSRQDLHRTPTSPFSPFPESSSGRTKLHRAAFAFTDDLHADSFPQHLPSSQHTIVSTPTPPETHSSFI